MDNVMVGTVTYMPPEQAMPGEVTNKADLYSLGAMLYEMVTGRPPFVGDDSVSIIGQHLNMQPISPTWHRADLPPAMESLIMLLLEKDPEKRPASAKDVLAALESIEKGDIKEQTVETQAPTENPIYRRIFVGRENELKTLQNTFIGAMSGQGALIMVVGEPGIGKTSVCEELATFVTLRGGMTLWGHCYEEGSLSLPYLAFVEAIRSYVLDRETDELKKELGSGASDVARIVSEVREKLHIEPREAQTPEEDRYRLMQAVTSFLTNAAAVKPMLVILEDLHDADKGMLEMLEYMSRNLQHTRLMIIGTYRDVEVDRNHPLSASLAELRRVSSFGRVLLRGLNVDEVRRMLTRITNEGIPVSLAEAVHRQTEGNPLFVQEVVRYLTEEKLLITSGGKMKTSDITKIEMNIPEGLRDVIGKRLTNLSEECNKLLSIAAVIGRDFSLEILRLISDVDEDSFINALKEAVQTGVLEERKQVGTVRYRFTHAFFRQTLYEEMIAPQRLRLHQQVARALEQQYDKRLAEHASELAEHFSQSTDPTDLEKAVEYGEMAAKRAYEVYAYGEAVRLLDQTIKVQEILDFDNKSKRCELYFNLCRALSNVGDYKRINESVAEETLQLAESIGDTSIAGELCRIAMSAMYFQGGPNVVSSPAYQQWIEKSDKYAKYAKPGTVGRVYADIHQASAAAGIMDVKSRERVLSNALELAKQLNDTTALIYSYTNGSNIYRLPQNFDKLLPHTEEFLSIMRSLPINNENNQFMGNALSSIGGAYLMAGMRKHAEEVWDEAQDLWKTRDDLSSQLHHLMIESVRAVLDGRLEEAVELSEQIRDLSEEAGILAGMLTWVRRGGMRAHIYRGISREELDRWHPGFWDRESQWASPIHSLILAHWGQYEKVIETLDNEVVNRPGMGSDNDDTMTWRDTFFLEVSVLSGHKKSAQLLYDRLNIPGLVTQGPDVPTCIPRHLGGVMALLGEHDKAREHYNDAVKVCTEMPFRPELALSRLELAELLLDHYPEEKAEATKHLDFAIKEFREMKMQPSLERALRRKDILKA
jgi:hypothetical protein